LFRNDDALSAPYESAITDGRTLKDPHLAAMLGDREFGAWALSATTVDFLEKHIRRVKPHRVLEFGSGLSTVCLAHFLKESVGDGARLTSIDQSAEYLPDTRALLEQLELSELVDLQVRPLRAQTFADGSISTYDFDESFFAELSSSPPDIVLVDGPSASVRGRFAALVLVRPYLRSGTTVFLDDALRDGELGAARSWRASGVLEVKGVYILGKGLLVGRIPPQRVPA
jgi:predicted O-methyltransferase YrrM